MRVDDDLMSDSDAEDGNEDRSLVAATRFDCNDIFLSESDDSDGESMQRLQVTVMDPIGVVEGAFHEIKHEYQLGVKEEIRNQLVTLETQLVAEKEKSASAYVQVEKNTDARRQMDRKLDLHYQRKIAEALDNHLTAIQRDHEHRTQMEERRIRDDAALEEAKRKEKALQEERIRLQKAKEEEARQEAAKKAEEAAQEAERLAKEAADKLVKEKSGKDAIHAKTGPVSALPNAPSTSSTPNDSKTVKSAGNLVRAAENALKLEARRIQTYKELEDRNQSIISSSNMDFRPKEREIARQINQVTCSISSVRSKANNLVNIFNDRAFPQSVTVAIFAKKVISYFETSEQTNGSYFACCHVITYVSAQVPAVMECLLAEFHRACIYTVPKHIMSSKSAFGTEDNYFKAIGYKEEDGELEKTDNYLKRLGSVMKLYGALVQTEAEGVQNMHGLEEGWRWLARFLNAIPPNEYTAVALEAFLGMAGFALHRKYKSQFRKILSFIYKEFVHTLRSREDPRVSSVIRRLQVYIESQEFLQEPDGWRLQSTLLSHTSVPNAEYQQEQYNHNTPRRFTYQR
ncbi:hypothetical protein BVRB_6g147230 [Beta vulgaris subsp. vulgaris]|nr:hypothetical protein BVRB_6g147230 [Beta vulgaris subsp. vulgaris]